MGFDNNDNDAKLREASGTLNKLYEDIQDLTRTRSSLQNEIAFARQSLKEKIDSEYQKHCEVLKAMEEASSKEIQQRKDKIKEQEIVLHNKLVEAETIRQSVIADKEMLEAEKAQWKELKKKEYEKIEAEYSAIADTKAGFEEREDLIDKRQFGLEAVEGEINQQEFELKMLIKDKQKILDEISEREINIRKDRDFIKNESLSIENQKKLLLEQIEALAEENKKREELINYEKEIESARKEKAKAEEKINQIEEEKKSLSAINDKLVEKENSLNEREKVLGLQMRENDKKIAIIKQLREELKKNV